MYDWTLDLKNNIKYKTIKKIDAEKLHHQFSDAVLSNHEKGLKFSASNQNLDNIISDLSTTTNLEKGVICSFNIDTMNFNFFDNGLNVYHLLNHLV